MENTCLIILLFYGQLIQEKCIILNIFTIYSTKTYLLLNVLYPQNTPHQSTTILDHFKEKKALILFYYSKSKIVHSFIWKKICLVDEKKNYKKIIITTRHPKKVKSLYSTSKYHTTKNNHTTHRRKKKFSTKKIAKKINLHSFTKSAKLRLVFIRQSGILNPYSCFASIRLLREKKKS